MVSVAEKQQRDAPDVRENGTVTGKTCYVHFGTRKGNGTAKIPSANMFLCSLEVVAE